VIINCKPDGSTYHRSSLERRFEFIWLHLFPGIDLQVEMKLVPGRLFRSDYCHWETKTVIEINGGQFGKSSHKGSASDAEKQNSLVRAGYFPYVLWTSQVNPQNIEMIGEFIRRKRGENDD
jgi:very-short-patch-repair endonuclease